MKKLLALLLVVMLALGICSVAAADEDVTLKFLIDAGSYDLDSDIGWEVCQRVSGYKIDYEVINGTEQLMLIISSGQEYDYCYMKATNWDLMMSEGALTDITDLLKEYGPNINEAFSALWPAVTVDGRIYGIPSTAAQPNSLVASMVARKDLLKAIGYETLPTDLDAFIKMLEDIKVAYPDMVPLTASKTYIISNIASAFNVQGTYQLIDGKVTCVVDNPNLKAYIECLRDLYARELLDQEISAITVADMRNNWAASKAVVLYNNWAGVETPIAALRALVPDMEYEVLPLFPDANGKVHAQTKSGVGAYCGIPVTSKHAKETIMAINNMIQIDNFTEIVLGIEGTHYTKKEGGGYAPIQPAFNNDKNNSNVFVSGFYREDVYPVMWEARLAKNADLQSVFYAYRASLLDGGEPSPVVIAPTVTVVDNKATLETKITDTLLAVITGAKGIEELDTLKKYWDDNGGTQIIEFYNEWYAANMQ